MPFFLLVCFLFPSDYLGVLLC